MSEEIPPWLAERDARSRKKRSLPKGCGFLMAVIATIALLGAAGFYGFSLQVWDVKQKELRIMCKTLSNAVEQFDADYSRLPLPSGPPPQGGDRDTDTSPAHGFTAVLLGQEADSSPRQNPNATNYLEGFRPAKPKPTNDSPWQIGVITDPATGSFGMVDFSGKPFRIRLDTNDDKQVANPNPDEVAAGRPTLPKRVIVWGAGKDGKWETWDDNPKSWE